MKRRNKVGTEVPKYIVGAKELRKKMSEEKKTCFKWKDMEYDDVTRYMELVSDDDMSYMIRQLLKVIEVVNTYD